MQAGEKSLTNVFEEQNNIISQIGREKRLTTDTTNLQPQSRATTEVSNTLEGLSLKSLLTTTNPCPSRLVGTPGAERFRIWLDNCQRYNMRADDMLDHVQSGRMTLEEMMDEQDCLILQLSERNSSQKEDGPESLVGFTLPDLYRLGNPCPQSVQGAECDKFKLWLENCARYGSIADCEAQLQGFTSGRKTLSEIFAEQQEQIKMFAVKREKVSRFHVIFI